MTNGSSKDRPQAGAQPAARADAPGSAADRPQAPAAPPMSRGDQAPAGTPGTGEDICPACGGSGTVRGTRCPDCDGTGKVTVGIGGG